MKVYVSVFGDERGKEVALTGLKSKAKYVRSELGRRMKLRLTPEIRFIEDESLERGSRVSNSIYFLIIELVRYGSRDDLFCNAYNSLRIFLRFFSFFARLCCCFLATKLNL